MRQSAPGLSVELRQENHSPVRISRLINSIYYFIENVFIASENESYRLVAVHHGNLLTNETYKTAKGARIAFFKFWSYRAWEEGVKPKWSRFYPPDPEWLEKQLKGKTT
ncbi:MAG: hypothetical protein GY858_10195 [Candidatus Omnitrophica bacterium]|nr:hypothetical protein [Candidatus Omnitrophota bacterium]